MNFVIFSYNFLPLNDAEAFCTARFANALAAAGHHVHVVTMDHPHQLPDDVVQELIPRIQKISRIPLKPTRKSIFSRVYYQTPEWDAINYWSCIKLLRHTLQEYDHPILISRMCPAASGIIAWHCRKKAALWIHHFSDPFPSYLKDGFFGRIMNWFTFRWTRRFLTDSIFCTVTCNEVIPFFEKYFGQQSRRRFVLLPHIGDPFLNPCEWNNIFGNTRFMAHVGNCYDGRYATEIVRELQILGKESIQLGFLQAGAMLEKDQELIKNSGIDFRMISLHSPRLASAIFNEADINLVVDLKANYGYTPFIPSKFVYLLFTDRPIVVFARKDSWMYQLVQEYPESEIAFADVNEPGALATVMRNILSGKSAPDRTRIRKVFSSENIVKMFEKEIDSRVG